MSEIVSRIFSQPEYFLLLLVRMTGIVVPSPVFGRVNMPVQVKICFSLAMGYMAFTYFPPVESFGYETLFGFAFAIAGELLIGMAIAFVTNMFFTLVFTGGQLIDMQIGFGIVNVYDPQNNTQVPMIGNLFNLILLIVFWGVDGHHKLLAVFFSTLRALPVGNVLLSPSIGVAMLELFAKCFTLGTMVALPVIASGITIELGFGVLMRTVPQLNMFVVGVPIKLLIGLLILVITIPAFVAFSDRIFGEMFTGVDRMLQSFYSAA